MLTFLAPLHFLLWDVRCNDPRVLGPCFVDTLEASAKLYESTTIHSTIRKGDPALVTTDARHHRYLTNEKGDKEAIILPLNEYEELLGDIDDLAVVLERRGESTLSLEEVKKRLRDDGLLQGHF